MQEISKLIDDIIDERICSSEILKHIRGFVISANENNSYADVNIGNKTVTLINKTGEELGFNDEVTIHYWTNIANGYIAIRHGRSNTKAGSLNISKAPLLTTRQSNRLTVDPQLIATDDKNDILVNCGSQYNRILINGYAVSPLVLKNHNSSTAVVPPLDVNSTEFIAMVNSVPDILTYHDVTLNELDSENIIQSRRYYTTVGSVEFAANSGGYGLQYTPCAIKEGTVGAFLNSTRSWQRDCTRYINLVLFYSSIHAANSDEKSGHFSYGYADIVMVLKCEGYSLSLAEIRCGFASQDEFDYALTITSKSEIIAT